MIAARWQTRAAVLVAVVALVAGLAVMLSAAPAGAGGRHTTTTAPELVIECPAGTHPVGTTGHSWVCAPDTTSSTRPAMTTSTTTSTPSSVSLIPPAVLDAPAVPVETTPEVTG